jgi:hypothetical protein
MSRWNEDLTIQNRPAHFHYKGLVFVKYKGQLSREEIQSRVTFYAFYGSKPMAPREIQYRVDQMIDRGQLPRPSVMLEKH